MPRHPSLQRAPVAAATAAAVAALFSAAGAAAQTVAAPAAAASQPEPARTVITLGVVEVTAQKTRENPQKVPLSITAISGDALADAGVRNALDLQGRVTSVNVVQQGPGASVQIRGIGSNPGGGNIDPSVAFSLDGIYQARSSSAFGSMYDVERVEVLKGPQGTLYGRNATVGAVNVITRRPVDRLEGEVALEGGNYNLLRGSGMVNIPLNETVKLRLAVQSVMHDGYLSDGYNDANDTAGRIKLLIEPHRDLSVLLSADAHRKIGNGGGNIFTGTVTDNGQTHTPRRDDPADPWHLTPVVLSPLPYFGPSLTGLNSPSHVGTGHAEPANAGLDVANDGLGAEINWNLGSTTLTVLPARRKSFVSNQGSTSGNLIYPVFNRIDQVQDSLEVRLASNARAPLRWLAGYFYLDEDAPTFLAVRAPGLTDLAVGNTTYTDMGVVHARSQAVFGQATWTFRTDTRATAGLRYTADDKEQHGSIYRHNLIALDGSGTPVGGPAANHRIDSTFSDSAVNYKLGIDHDLNPTAMVYASLGTGYKSGGLNFVPVSAVPGDRHAFKPEKLLALAAGGKSRWLDNRLQLNGEIYYWEYKDQQIPIVDQSDTPTGVRDSAVATLLFINNPGPSKLYGFDLDASYMPSADDRLTAALAYLHARNGRFVLPATQFVIPTGPTTTLTIPLEPATDVSGKVLPFSPTWALNLGYQHFWGLESGATFTASFDAHAETRSYVNYHLFEPERQPGYVRSNLALSYLSPDGQLTITAYVRNLSNVAVLTRGAVGGGSNGSAPAHYANIADPRTVGLVVNVKF